MKVDAFIHRAEWVAGMVEGGLYPPLEIVTQLGELEAARRELFRDAADWPGFAIIDRGDAYHVAYSDPLRSVFWGAWIFHDQQLTTEEQAEMRTALTAVLRAWAGRARECLATEKPLGRPASGRISEVREFIAANCMKISDRDKIQEMLKDAGLGHVSAADISTRKQEIRHSNKRKKLR